MKIFICASKAFYNRVPEIESQLLKARHKITLPNSYDNPQREDQMRNKGKRQHAMWKGEMIKEQARKIKKNDAILVLNFEKNGQPNYIGGAVFLEMFKAYELGRKIFLYNPVPEGMLKDEILGFSPKIINGKLERIR